MTHVAINTPQSIHHSDPDRELLELVAEHDQLFEACGADDDADVPADAVTRMCELEILIAAKPAHTDAGLAGKLKAIQRAEFDYHLHNVIRKILKEDRARVAG